MGPVCGLSIPIFLVTGESSFTGASAGFYVTSDTCAADPVSGPSVSSLPPSHPIPKKRITIQKIERKNILSTFMEKIKSVSPSVISSNAEY